MNLIVAMTFSAGIIGGSTGLLHVRPPDPMDVKHQLEQARRELRVRSIIMLMCMVALQVYQQVAAQRQQLVLQLQDLQQQFMNMANTHILQEQHLYQGNPSGAAS